VSPGKRALRGAVETASQAVGLLSMLERRLTRGLTVLMYHRVLPDEQCRELAFPSLVMPASAFRAQLEWLAGNAQVLPLGSALALEGTPASDLPRVAVTFDDGYADNAAVAAPIAEACGLRLTFFVTTDFVGAGRALWFDRAHALLTRTGMARRLGAWEAAGIHGPAPVDPAPGTWIQRLKYVPLPGREAFLVALQQRAPALAENDAPAPMSPEDVRALARAGHEIGSHGTGHSVHTTLADEELRHELEHSRSVLQEWIGAAPTGLAYPNGDHDERVRAAVRAAGYAWACTTRSGLHRPGDDPMRIPRRDITPNAVLRPGGAFDLRGFRCELSGLRDAWRRESAA